MTPSNYLKAITTGANQAAIDLPQFSCDLVRIPAGEFNLGSAPDESGHQPNEAPQRHIRISKAFYISRYEITQAQFKAVAGLNPSDFQGENLAVDQVTLTRAMEFCKKLSWAAKLTVTLPTEAQWEYACRGGTDTRFYSGTLSRTWIESHGTMRTLKEKSTR